MDKYQEDEEGVYPDELSALNEIYKQNHGNILKTQYLQWLA